MDPAYSELQDHTSDLIASALAAADPRQILRQAVARSPAGLNVDGQLCKFVPGARLLLLSVGKAASPMALTAQQLIQAKLDPPIIVRPEYDRAELPADWQDFRAGHPLPNLGSLAAGRAVAAAVRGLQKEDLLIVLLSGGGSALLELLKPGIQLEDLLQVNDNLLRSGAPIEQINLVRKSMSLIKGGGLAKLAAPARILALILSDVVGDDLSVIASGPTVAAEINPNDARIVLKKYNLWGRLSQRLQGAILTPHPDPPQISPVQNFLLANNLTVSGSVARKASQIGFEVQLNEVPLRGEAREAGAEFGRQLRRLSAANPDRCHCLVQGGETTVTVHGEGRGGRNQEFALAAALAISEASRTIILSLATDGVDGPTDAAGAILATELIDRMRAAGQYPERFLEKNDVYTLLKQFDALIHTGPTQTNLNDIAVGLSYARR